MAKTKSTLHAQKTNAGTPEERFLDDIERRAPSSADLVEQLLNGKHRAAEPVPGPDLTMDQKKLLDDAVERLQVVNATLDLLYTLSSGAVDGNIEELSAGTLNHAMYGAIQQLDALHEDLNKVRGIAAA